MKRVAEVDHDQKLIVTVVEWPDDAVIVDPSLPVMWYEDAIAAGYVPQKIEQEPISVLLWQLRASLEIDGLLTRIQAALDALPKDQQIIVKSAWEYSTQAIKSNSSTVVGIAKAARIGAEQMRLVFERAANLSLP
jgi:hypothetical protein